jgi:cytidylate kinase
VTRPVIAVDGSSGSGKSTLATSLARHLGVPYLNTGLMYRSVAAAALRDEVGLDDGPGLAELARSLRFTIGGTDPSALEVEGWSPELLTTLEVDRTVSAVARHPEVREVLRAEQRRLGAPGAVVEGRDIGSVVFPGATLKLHLVADPDDRVRRRARDRRTDDVTAAAVVLGRDRSDAPTTPDTPAPGAVVIDTTTLDGEATLQAALRALDTVAEGDT